MPSALERLLIAIDGAAASVGPCATCDGGGVVGPGESCDPCAGEGIVSAAAALLRIQEAAAAARATLRPPAAPPPELSPDVDSWMDGTLGPPPSTWDLVRARIKADRLVPAGLWIERDVEKGRYVALAEAEPRPMRCGDYDLVANAQRFAGKRFCVVTWLKEGDRLVGYRHAPIDLKSLKLA